MQGDSDMTLMKWDPFRNMVTLQDRINRLFEDAFPRAAETEEDLVCAWRPVVDIYETEQGGVIMVDLPGVNKEDVSVEVKENVLTIQGERKPEMQVENELYYRRERACGTFQRSFSFRSVIAPDTIKASFRNGVLKVEIPKPEEEKPKKVSVSIE
jgi:HSP20 family protein